MAAIYLIRHGQASFAADDYDQLSTIGEQQSVILGEFFQNLLVPSAYYAGELKRHQQTLSYFHQGISGNNDSPLKNVKLNSGFNEFDHEDVLHCYNPTWKNFADMAHEIQDKKQANKIFQQEFSQAIRRWVLGENDDDYKETWTEFKQRCVSALKALVQQQLLKKPSGNSHDIFVFTSGGTISVIVQHILGLSDEIAFLINQQLRNTSVTKLLFSDSKISLDYLNNHHHLTLKGEQWETFR